MAEHYYSDTIMQEIDAWTINGTGRNRSITSWTQKDGSTIAIIDMSNVHLLNTIKLIYKQWEHRVGMCAASMMQVNDERELYEWDMASLHQGPSIFSNAYDALIEEAHRRGLDPFPKHSLLEKEPA